MRILSFSYFVFCILVFGRAIHSWYSPDIGSFIDNVNPLVSLFLIIQFLIATWMLKYSFKHNLWSTGEGLLLSCFLIVIGLITISITNFIALPIIDGQSISFFPVVFETVCKEADEDSRTVLPQDALREYFLLALGAAAPNILALLYRKGFSRVTWPERLDIYSNIGTAVALILFIRQIPWLVIDWFIKMLLLAISCAVVIRQIYQIHLIYIQEK